MGYATLMVRAVCIVCSRADWGMDAEVEGDEQPDRVDFDLQHAVLGQRQSHQSRRKRLPTHTNARATSNWRFQAMMQITALSSQLTARDKLCVELLT